MLDGLRGNTKTIELFRRNPVWLVFDELPRVVGIRDPGRFLRIRNNLRPIFLPREFTQIGDRIDPLSSKKRLSATGQPHLGVVGEEGIGLGGGDGHDDDSLKSDGARMCILGSHQCCEPLVGRAHPGFIRLQTRI